MTHFFKNEVKNEVKNEDNLPKKSVTTWKWFKIYVTKLDYLEKLFQDDLRKNYFDNLRFVSEVYYNVNYNLEIVTRMEDKAIKKDSLNKRIGIIYNNIQIIKKIIKKSRFNPDSKEEKRAYNIVVDQLQRVKKTIQNYFILLEKLETQVKIEKRNRKEINYEEEVLDDEELENEDLDDEDYDPENEEDKYQEKCDKKYDNKYYKYVQEEDEDQEDEEQDYILEIDKNNSNHVRFIYV
jgi:hypothetical protein